MDVLIAVLSLLANTVFVAFYVGWPAAIAIFAVVRLIRMAARRGDWEHAADTVLALISVPLTVVLVTKQWDGFSYSFTLARQTGDWRLLIPSLPPDWRDAANAVAVLL